MKNPSTSILILLFLLPLVSTSKMNARRAPAKQIKGNNKMEPRVQFEENDSQPAPVASFAKKTIWGQNIINVRSFNIDSPRKYEFLGSFTNSVPIYPSPEIAFFGRSNVGKSSLLNCLTGLNKKLAVESKTPGRTRGVNLFRCSDRVGPICTFVDLPGYGYAQMTRTLQEDITDFVRIYLNERGSLRLAVLLIDIRREPQDSDLAMAQYLQETGLSYIVIATKVDKLKKEESIKALNILRSSFSLPADQPIPFSAITGQGKRSIWHAIRRGIVGEESDLTDEEEEEDNDDDDDGDYTLDQEE